MNDKNYTTSFTVDQSPGEVFAAINNVRGWWSGEIEGITDQPGAEFTYRVPDAHRSKQKVTQFIPGKKVAWHVSDARLDFVKDKGEWKGTEIVFDISKKVKRLKSASLTLDWPRRMNVTMPAQMHGACSSTVIFAN